MARAAWQGYIMLGQLAVPVKLYRATQDQNPHFVLLHTSDNSPVERTLQCRAEGKTIKSTDVTRAVEYAPGQYITLSDQELAVSEADFAKRITIQQFCSEGALPPQYFERPYYMVPSKGGERAYALLRDVLARASKVAIAELVLYRRQHLAMIGVQGDMLLLLQLRFAGELIPRASIKTPPLPKPSPVEIDTLSAVVERFSGPLYLADYHDTYAEQLQSVVSRKSRGLSPLPRERLSPHATPEDQLVNALESTLHAVPTSTPVINNP